jgi:hypothetical protein
MTTKTYPGVDHPEHSKWSRSHGNVPTGSTPLRGASFVYGSATDEGGVSRCLEITHRVACPYVAGHECLWTRKLVIMGGNEGRGRMALAKVYSCAVVGLDGVLVEVEVDVGNPHGQPGIVIVGLPDSAVQESRERVRAAIRHSGGRVPFGKITVNLAPADLKKAGPTYDLPIALGILLGSEQILADVSDSIIVGELSLDGVLRHTPGIISMISLAAQKGMRRAFVPFGDASEAVLIEGVEIYALRTLSDLVNHLTGDVPIAPYVAGDEPPVVDHFPRTDFSEIRGQEHVKRGLEVAAAGAHNVLTYGTQGPPPFTVCAQAVS